MTGKDLTLREMVQGYTLLLPLLLFVGALILVPVAGTVVTSLYRDVTFLPKQFVGADNYP